MDKLVTIRVGDKLVDAIACCLNCHDFYRCSKLGLDDKLHVSECLPEHSLWTQ